MTELKTQRNRGSVKKFINAIENDTRRTDAETLLKMMKDITGEKAEMWGENIVGFGTYQFEYASGRSGKWFLTGFSPRKASLSLYLTSSFKGYEALLKKLGKHKTGKSCLYITKLEQVDLDVLRELIAKSVAHVREHQKGC